MIHPHDHEHQHKNQQNLTIILVLTFIYMLAEFLGGVYSNSLALIADAGHMLSDIGAIGVSLFAVWLSQKPASSEKTYGYYRTEIIAAFINGLALVGIAFFIIYEAYTRLYVSQEVKAPFMIVIAGGGLVINFIGASLLHKSCHENLNIQGAFLHILGDLAGAFGTVIAGIIILAFRFYPADSIISIIIALLILISAVQLVVEAVNILLEASPSHINVENIRETLLEVQDIHDVHDLHVWSLSSKNIAFSVHIVSDVQDYSKLLCLVDELFRKNSGYII